MSTASPTLAATVILPTSIDRGPTLELAAESVLRQTVSDLELFIIGDGAHENTRRVAEALVARDSRVRFFDHPKGVSRSEFRRHEALAQARGRIVCYQIDRDLWLPDHVAEMDRALRRADMVHSLTARILETGYDVSVRTDLSLPEDRARFARDRDGLPLALGAHTLAAYRRLSEGWATTPPGWFTDSYFWSKFARNPAFRCEGLGRLTVLNFQRGNHPGWSTERRLPELRAWAARLAEPGGVERIRAEVCAALARERVVDAHRLRRPLLLWGKPLDRVGVRETRHALEKWAARTAKRDPGHVFARWADSLLKWNQRRLLRRLPVRSAADESPPPAVP